MTQVSAEAITAVAATLAAILSGITLAITGRRNERRWRREALTDVLVMFLDSTFKGAPGDAFELVRQGKSPEKYRQGAIDSHAVMVDSITKLRMLANLRVVRTAEEFHSVQDRIYDAIYKPSDPPMPVHDFNALKAQRIALRNQFIKLARRNLGLSGATPINDTTPNMGPSMRATSKEIPEMKIHFLNETSPRN